MNKVTSDSHVGQIREERRQTLEEHVQTVQQILRDAANATGPLGQADNPPDEEWDGLSDNEVPEAPIDLEEEYIDEDRYTTVTVEAVRVDRDGLHRTDEDVEQTTEKSAIAKSQEAEEKAESGKKEWPKKKKKVFRYEDKHERKVAERKQKAKRGKPRDR